MSNVLVLLVVTFAGARSYSQWLIRLIFTPNKLSPLDRPRITKPFFNHVGQETLEALKRLFNDPSYHNLKNIGTALSEDDPQAMYKFYSFVIVVQSFIILILSILWSVL